MSDQGERELWLGRVAAVRQWRKGGDRAPHKPLLLLYALGRLQQGHLGAVPYRDAEPTLDGLLTEFGPPNRSKASYPFARLANDEGLWVVETPTGVVPDDTAKQLRDLDATGRLDPTFAAALHADPGLLALIARYLLEDNWPSSLHDAIQAAVGLDLDDVERALVVDRLEEERRRRRDPTFRDRVLLAYEFRCAICRYDGRIDNASVGLDAAHIRWWSADGPDELGNGLCLCSFHHLLLDRGVLGIDETHAVRVSKHFIGHSDTARDVVTRWNGAPLLEPQAGERAPDDEHVQWHGDNVFRGPARQPVG